MTAHGHGPASTKGHARKGVRAPVRRSEAEAPPPRHSAPTEGARTRPSSRSPVLLPVAVTAAALAVLLVGVLGVRLLDDGDSPATDLAGASQDSAAGDPAPSGAAPVPSAPPRTILPLVQAATADSRTPETAHAALSQLMAGRALVTTRLLRATLRDDAVIAAAAGGVLAGTAEDIAAVAGAYAGDGVATELQSRLDEQAAAALTLAEAVRDGESAETQAAAGELDAASAALGTSLERVTSGAVPAALLTADAGQLRTYVQAQSRGDHATAYGLERELQVRQAREGAALAATLAGPVDPAAATPQQQELAGRWSLLFGEHAVLAGDVVRAGLTGADDFPAAAAALDGNTAALTQAVGGVVPPEQAQRFAGLWADQIDGVVAYTRATAQGDDAGRAAAKTGVAASAGALTAFFAESTGGRLDAESLGPALERHAGALLGQADAWAETDAGGAYALAAADYAGLAGLAAPAANAFAQSIAAGAPVGGAATGWGGMAVHVR